MKFGRLTKRIDHRTLRFSRYAERLATPPLAADSFARGAQVLGIASLTPLLPMDGNDTLGDCTIAALAHAITVWRALVGEQHVMSEEDVRELYFALSGGQDTGLVELDVLNFWRQNAEGGDEIAAYVAVDPRDHTHVMQAIELFGGLYVGFNVQEAAIVDFEAKREWTPGSLTGDGHAVFVGGYDPDGVTLATWGALQRGSWAWWDECLDEAYAILPPEAQAKSFTPGFDYATLAGDLQALTQRVA